MPCCFSSVEIMLLAHSELHWEKFESRAQCERYLLLVLTTREACMPHSHSSVGTQAFVSFFAWFRSFGKLHRVH